MIDPPISILIVDDEPANLSLLEAVLADPGYRIVRANSASEALLALTKGDFALIILDICMPSMSGMELAQVLKERGGDCFVPIIFLTASFNDDPHMLEGYGKGAVDYLSKSVPPAVLRSKVAVFAELHRRSHAREHAEQQWRELTAALESRVEERTAALRAEEARLKLGVQVSGIALLDVDYDAGLKHLSAEAAHLLGLGDEAMSVPRAVVHALFHPDDLADSECGIEASLDPDGDGWLGMDHRIIRPDGEVRCLRVRQQVFFGGPPEARRPVRASCAIIDLTSEKKAARELAASDVRLHLATATSGVGLWDWNVITNEIRWDEQLFRIYGQEPTPSGIVPYSAWSGAVLSEDLPEQERVLQDTIKRMGHSTREFRIRRANDHEIRHLLCFETVRCNASGQAEWVTGTNRDITDRKLAVEALRNSQTRLALGMEVAGLALAEVDYPSGMNHLSAEAARLFGLGDAPMVVPRAVVHATFHPDDLAELMPLIAGSLDPAGDGWFKMDHRVIWPCGEVHWLRVRKQVFFEGEGSDRRPLRAMLAALDVTREMNITEIVRLNEALTLSDQTTSGLLADSRRLEEQSRFLSHRLLVAEEEERKRISRELHDVIAQALAGINMRLTYLKAHATTSIADLHHEIAQTQKLVEQSVDTVHRFARDLRPSMLDFLGLVPALESYLQEFTQRTGIPVTVVADDSVAALASAERTVLYRIAQEALTNVDRHAKATRVIVSIHQHEGNTCMDIEDDGQGFEADGPGSATKKGRLGMLGMRERVEMIGGCFQVESAPGQPTTVRVAIPTTSFNTARDLTTP